ncbi:uncharacterized protein [Medicago truncatula]|uniref:uncharacterized protein n=1 Tax=Medicago truncatula TaxID=3880 RepID=UPI000D2F1D48|nr:uncharacterized protein LOC25499063 [Medicago truncatula]XP_024625622.1 uncharacterized protein LOC25499063 [Medicago truncatula]
MLYFTNFTVIKNPSNISIELGYFSLFPLPISISISDFPLPLVSTNLIFPLPFHHPSLSINQSLCLLKTHLSQRTTLSLSTYLVFCYTETVTSFFASDKIEYIREAMALNSQSKKKFEAPFHSFVTLAAVVHLFLICYSSRKRKRNKKQKGLTQEVGVI